ncbi:MAG: hypothetical protein JSV44_10090 [Candidatus Zixiibacteriota bacterium]|nr:MAG: hypothetical protein JSV44_10090 [candidate division Zixibacteria bacterium]
MEINILYSKSRADHLRAAAFVKEAVKNLGISATINEWESKLPSPQVVVDGFDLINAEMKVSKTALSYDLIEKALEQTAWSSV